MWSSMEDKILCYSELTAEERLEVEQYVQQHPEMQPLLEEAKAFTALLGEAHLLRTASPGDEALAYYIATRNVSPHAVPEPLDEAFAGIEQHLTDDTALRSRYAELVRRMAVLEAASDPVEQFERLSGRRLARPQNEPVVPETEGFEAAQPKTAITPPSTLPPHSPPPSDAAAHPPPQLRTCSQSRQN